jgi:hypothetical protein
MIHFYEKKMLSSEEADALAADLDLNVDCHRLSNIHGGRFVLPNTSSEFKTLLRKSSAWNAFYQRIASQEFMEECFEHLEISDIEIEWQPYFSEHVVSNFFKKADGLRHRRVEEMTLKGLLAFFAYRSFKHFCFFLFRWKRAFSRKLSIDILFDVSRAVNGYKREIHRDSNSRLIVFLLYLNEIDKEGVGGTLDLFDYCGKDSDDPNPQPNPKNCKLIKAVSPEKGKLVIFKNDNQAFHSVPEMSGFDGQRTFCYGSFTIVSGTNPYLIKSKKKFETEWSMYF